MAFAGRLPVERRQSLRRGGRRLRRPAVLGTLRRTTPLSDVWGRDRGTPIDRYYIERFLERERDCVRGRVVELLDDTYTRRFGVGVERSDVLDIEPKNDRATIVGDLAIADVLPASSFDCFILTQTLQFVFDFREAIVNVHRALAPGGVVLCTVPFISRIGRRYLEAEFWRFAPAACERLFGDVFGPGSVRVEGHGNVLAGIGFLTGMAAEELSQRDLAADDPFFPVVVSIRALRTG